MKTISSYRHAADESGQEPDSQPGDYFVSVLDGGRLGLASGPYADHRAALNAVESCRRKCEELDPFTVFCAFGTVRFPVGCGHVGALQKCGAMAVPG